MDATVKSLLEYMSYNDAKALWEYLDSDPYAVSDMIEVIAESHKQLAIDLCGIDDYLPKKVTLFDATCGPTGYNPEYTTYSNFYTGYTGPDDHEVDLIEDLPLVPCSCSLCNPKPQSWLMRKWFGFWFWFDHDFLKGKF
jgi:hypothetical protein